MGPIYQKYILILVVRFVHISLFAIVISGHLVFLHCLKVYLFTSDIVCIFCWCFCWWNIFSSDNHIMFASLHYRINKNLIEFWIWDIIQTYHILWIFFSQQCKVTMSKGSQSDISYLSWSFKFGVLMSKHSNQGYWNLNTRHPLLFDPFVLTRGTL